MADLLERVEAEEENIGKALEALDEVMGREGLLLIDLAASATFLHNIYSGAENILKQVLKAEGMIVPESATWHKDLLSKAAEKGILSKALSADLLEFLAFRHFFVHGYGFMLREEPIKRLGAKMPGIWSEFIKEVKDYLKKKGYGKLKEKTERYAAKGGPDPIFAKAAKKLKSYGAKKAYVFGSYARGDQRKDSDLDIIVEFSGRKSLLDFVRIQQDLSDFLGVKVDLLSEDSISPYVLPYVHKEMKVILP